ncbi:MAG: MFS transporter [Oscillospiraceae bacterium]|jgi:Na+/melibiose symporter-like transporter|nr:MFS transporter [Oscillospiraceae bacterium]
MAKNTNAADERLNIKKTVLIGFGFMASSIAWAIYDPYVTTLLNGLLGKSDSIARWSDSLADSSLVSSLSGLLSAPGSENATGGAAFTLVPLLIGIIMTFDNVFGVIFQPAFGRLSDRCRSKWGKRRPFIFVGAPIAAVIFALIPWMPNIPGIMVTIILFVFVMSLWRAPVVALMPDLTPPKLRSEGNAIINLCGGVASAIGLTAGTIVAGIAGVLSLEAKGENGNIPYVFLLGSVVMIISTLVLRFFVQEPDSRLPVQHQATDGKAAAEIAAPKLHLRDLDKAPRRSLIFMLLCLFFLFSGANSIQTFFALFAHEQLFPELTAEQSAAKATQMLLVFAVCSMLAAIPAGKCGKKFGRKKTILSGLIAFMGVFLLYVLSKEALQSNALIWIALIIGGAANMFITVNTLPLVLEIGGLDKVGTFTGYYYTATFSAQIAAPIIYGVVRMFTGTYMSLFVYCPIMFALALLCILSVKHGEVDRDAVEETVKELELENAD